MKTLDRYLLSNLLPIFFISLFLFIAVLQLVDLFSNLWKYLTYDATVKDIFRVALLYTPKCVTYAVPMALLFSVSYTMGELYSRNELIIFFSSGIALRRLALSYLVFGAAVSFASFLFEEHVVIDAQRQKSDLTRILLKQSVRKNESDIAVKANNGRVVYAVDYFNDTDKSLNGLIIVERGEDGRFVRMVRARKARWVDNAWSLDNAISFRWFDGRVVSEPYKDERSFAEKPDTFRRSALDVESLKAKDAKAFIDDLGKAGFPVAAPMTDYLKRFSFAITPLVVVALAIGLGGRFRKNVLLMSLLLSLIGAVLYYVAGMLGVLLSKLGYLSPIIGAWTPAVLFILIGSSMLARART